MSGLPASWLATTLGSVIDYGKTIKVEPDQISDETWVLELEDVEKDTSRLLARVNYKERQSKSTKNCFDEGDVLYGKLRPYLNKVLIADRPGVCTTEIIPLSGGPTLDNRYLFYWLKNPKFLAYVETESHGMNMPRLGTDAGKAAPFVLAPLPEQKRIADKLDRTLARVEACRDRLDRLPALLKRFRQSVLAAATSGKLTEDWRAVHGQQVGYAADCKSDEKNISNSRNTVPLEQVLLSIRTGPFGSSLHKSDYVENGIPIVNPMHIGQGLITPSFQMTVNEETANRLADFRLVEGDVVIGRRGEMGRCAVVTPKEFGWLCGTGSMVLKSRPSLNPEYLQIFLSSPETVRALEGESVGSTMVNLNQKILLSLEIYCPGLNEQQEIIRRVETLFAFADRLEARLATARKQVNQLTPALLAKAFRGELVPQDPNDEPATELLKRLAADRLKKDEAAPKAKRGRKIAS